MQPIIDLHRGDPVGDVQAAGEVFSQQLARVALPGDGRTWHASLPVLLRGAQPGSSHDRGQVLRPLRDAPVGMGIAEAPAGPLGKGVGRDRADQQAGGEGQQCHLALIMPQATTGRIELQLGTQRRAQDVLQAGRLAQQCSQLRGTRTLGLPGDDQQIAFSCQVLVGAVGIGIREWQKGKGGGGHERSSL
ncbi:hypothetical protein ACQKO7_08015 [Pseudomonas putida]|uniref:hypothetical protein n=1 Tax=Pseudomonas putida TaxID=303 RepID=UPI003D062CCF